MLIHNKWVPLAFFEPISLAFLSTLAQMSPCNEKCVLLWATPMLARSERINYSRSRAYTFGGLCQIVYLHLSLIHSLHLFLSPYFYLSLSIFFSFSLFLFFFLSKSLWFSWQPVFDEERVLFIIRLWFIRPLAWSQIWSSIHTLILLVGIVHAWIMIMNEWMNLLSNAIIIIVQVYSHIQLHKKARIIGTRK